MGWVKLDDNFPDHPKVVAAGSSAAWLYICGLTYCSRFLTDGFIPAAQVPRLSDMRNPQALAQRLVEVGLWEQGVKGYVVHEYTRWQRTKEQVDSERSSARVRANFRRTNSEVRLPEAEADRSNPPNPPQSGGDSAPRTLNPRAAGTNPRARGAEADWARTHKDGKVFLPGSGWVG